MIAVALAIPVRDDRVLVARRAPDRHLGGFWEFPGGKIAPGEEPDAAARRELEEETGLVAGTIEPLLVLVHEYPETAIRFHVYLVREPQGAVRIEPPREWAWLSFAELRRLEMPPANRPMVSALRWRLAPSAGEA